MYLNDRPLSDFGLEPVSSDGRLNFAAGALQLATIPETSGAQIVRSELNRPRRLVIPVRLRGDTLAGYFTNRDSLADQLQGALEVRFSDVGALAERILYCQYEDFRVSAGEGPEWLNRVRTGELILVAGNPFFADRYALMTGEGAVLVGTAPAFELTTWLGGAITSPITITLKDFRGTTINALKWAGTINAGEWLEIRHHLAMVTKYTAVGAGTNAYSGLDEAVADFGFFEVTPDLADRAASAWPTITVTGGAAVSVHHVYRRGWN